RPRGAEAQHPRRRREVPRGPRPLDQPQRVRPHRVLDDPARVVPGRAREARYPQPRQDVRLVGHHPTFYPYRGRLKAFRAQGPSRSRPFSRSRDRRGAPGRSVEPGRVSDRAARLPDMAAHIRNIVIECGDARALATFYAELLGWRIIRTDWLLVAEDEQSTT